MAELQQRTVSAAIYGVDLKPVTTGSV